MRSSQLELHLPKKGSRKCLLSAILHALCNTTIFTTILYLYTQPGLYYLLVHSGVYLLTYFIVHYFLACISCHHLGFDPSADSPATSRSPSSSTNLKTTGHTHICKATPSELVPVVPVPHDRDNYLFSKPWTNTFNVCPCHYEKVVELLVGMGTMELKVVREGMKGGGVGGLGIHDMVGKGARGYAVVMTSVRGVRRGWWFW